MIAILREREWPSYPITNCKVGEILAVGRKVESYVTTPAWLEKEQLCLRFILQNEA